VSEKRESSQPFPINSKHVIIVLFALVVAAIIHVRVPYWIGDYRVGDIATGTIRAPSDFLVSQTGVTIKKGEVIARKGQTISPADLQKLSALRTKEELNSPITERFLFLFLILLVSVIIIYYFAEKNIRKFTLSDKDLTFCLLLTTIVTLLVKLCMVLFEQFIPDHAQDLFYVIPLFAFGMVMRVVFFSEAVFIF
jgi:membrane-associated HD superfamily phosphohydrolase